MILRQIKKQLKTLSILIDKKIYTKKDFVIISNNCWGAELYKRIGIEYNTPFVGLYVFGPDYLKLLESFDYYLECELSFQKTSKWITGSFHYPVGMLDDIEIHFLHYKDNEEAKFKWDRRLERMKSIKDKDKYYFKICDRDLTDSNIIIHFHNLPFKNKISFGINEINHPNHLQIKENEDHKFVPNGLELYKLSYLYLDVLGWINSGKITKNWYSKIKSIAKIT
jgi:uncharacterized protein (DUF1919 family)